MFTAFKVRPSRARSRRGLSPCLRDTTEKSEKPANTGPNTVGYSHDAVDDDPDEQYLDAMGQSMSYSLHCSCLSSVASVVSKMHVSQVGPRPRALLNWTDLWDMSHSDTIGLLRR